MADVPEVTLRANRFELERKRSPTGGYHTLLARGGYLKDFSLGAVIIASDINKMKLDGVKDYFHLNPDVLKFVVWHRANTTYVACDDCGEIMRRPGRDVKSKKVGDKFLCNTCVRNLHPDNAKLLEL